VNDPHDSPLAQVMQFLFALGVVANVYHGPSGGMR
jgi:hypothetical protein